MSIPSNLGPIPMERLAHLTALPDAPVLNVASGVKLKSLSQLLPKDELLALTAQGTHGSLPSSMMSTDPSQPTINPDTRVLHIGDSHTVGIYGREMDKHFRETGAKVETYGSAGSSPSWWLQGTTTHSGFYSKNEDEKVDSPKNWRTPRKTPRLKALLQKFKPNVIVISLGANMIRNSDGNIHKQVEQLTQIAEESGAKIIWVGPPDGRESKKPTSRQAGLYESLASSLDPSVTFIDSRPFTEYPSKGGDGLHYWGKEGARIARSWAAQVFEQIQTTP